MTTASSEDRIAEAAAGSAELLLYDYFKHLTTLSLVALGGALGIAPEKVGRNELGLVVITIGLAGGIALMGLLAITRARSDGLAMPRQVRLYRSLSGGFFSFGIGMFLVLSVSSL
ncbi:hypothetical protein ABC347_12335 [Sphingomonas sp. 1P06PA]|uniref:hypothetical protein n=1 Tax=Sphingomonas sp. 1P06PA TaxID=554121 RepID=UPI0039A74F39